MIRSYVLTFAFVNFRWWIDFPLISSAGTAAERLITISWLGWALPLFATEVALQWKRMPLSKPSQTTAGAGWKGAHADPSALPSERFVNVR